MPDLLNWTRTLRPILLIEPVMNRVDHMYGTIFNINRFSLYDGPGIRTTIFLKGCMLDCKWCHNPESKSQSKQFSFQEERCINCGKCKGLNARILKNQYTIEEVIEYETAILCKREAIKIIGEDMSVEDVIKVIVKDEEYYKESSGGVTISGGEPLVQYEFLKVLTKGIKDKGIHVALETCGNVSPAKYKQLLPYIDLFLFDYKMTNERKFKEYTRGNKNVIDKNFQFLYESKKKIILRCPIIPTINYNEEHFKAICDISLKYPDLEYVELLPYHNYGFGKAKQIGMDYELDINSIDGKDEIELIKDKFRKFQRGKIIIRTTEI